MKIGGNYTLTGLIAFMIWLTPVDALAQDKNLMNVVCVEDLD